MPTKPVTTPARYSKALGTAALQAPRHTCNEQAGAALGGTAEAAAARALHLPHDLHHLEVPVDALAGDLVPVLLAEVLVLGHQAGVLEALKHTALGARSWQAHHLGGANREGTLDGVRRSCGCVRSGMVDATLGSCNTEHGIRPLAYNYAASMLGLPEQVLPSPPTALHMLYLAGATRKRTVQQPTGYNIAASAHVLPYCYTPGGQVLTPANHSPGGGWSCP